MLPILKTFVEIPALLTERLFKLTLMHEVFVDMLVEIWTMFLLMLLMLWLMLETLMLTIE